LLIIILVKYKNNLFLNTTENDKSNASSFIYNFLSINENKKYDKLGKRIYSSKGSLSFNYLDKVFKKTKIDDSNSNFNHIHVAMSFNNDYHLLSSVSIASLLKNSAPTSFIHLHIIAVDGWVYPTMKKLNSLKYKINRNCEFIFHNGEQALKDFGEDSKKDATGIGDYARLLAPYFANDTDRLIITDSADLFFEKDLLELYNYPLDDKFVKGIEDPYTSCFSTFIFFKKENYFNGGVLLVNAKKWREFDLYHDLVTFYKAFNYQKKLMAPI
jgi:lipopolysaccharide biosynthesis glycosyltransferase